MASNIKNQLFSGVFYTALAKYSGIVISLVIAGILARLLSPDDFGIVAVATVIIAFFSLLTDMGISPAIIQHKSLTKDELSTIFSFTVWTGIGISILFFAASWMIADYYESEILRTLCQLLSVNLFFASATIVPGALFYRNKEFKFIAIRSFVIQISAGAAGVAAPPRHPARASLHAGILADAPAHDLAAGAADHKNVPGLKMRSLQQFFHSLPRLRRKFCIIHR